MTSQSQVDLGGLVAYNGSLLMAHWAADTVTNEHKALGDLYDSMVELTDSFAEVYMGKCGVVEPTEQTITVLSNPTEEGLSLVEDLLSNFTEGEDDDLINILADMQAALHKAQYLLKAEVDDSGEVENESEEEDTTEEPVTNTKQKAKQSIPDKFSIDDMPKS
jgi:hypothetical protein